MISVIANYENFLQSNKRAQRQNWGLTLNFIGSIIVKWLRRGGVEEYERFINSL